MSDSPTARASSTNSDATTAPPVPVAWRSRLAVRRFIVLLVVPLIVVLASAGVYLNGGRYVETENAYVKADKVPVSAEVSGTIKEVLVDENQPVRAGQVMFRLDPAPFQVTVEKAEAKLAQVRTDLAVLKAGYRTKEAETALARTRHAFALKEQERQADLVARNFVSASRFDEARQSTDLAAQQITAMEQDLKRIAETLGGSFEAAVEQHPSYRAAQAELDQARLDLSRVQVRAAVAGTVTKPPKQGQYVAAGSTALALVASNLWVEANFTETDLTYVRVGQPVAIHIDTFPDKAWRGSVDSLSPATGAEFSVIPAQNATGNWVKIAQRVSVRIKINEGFEASQLRAGLSATVRVDTGHRRRLLGMSL
jgi:membrane fusion protein (multidrug efflux system)